jgi:hypothetical protein
MLRRASVLLLLPFATLTGCSDDDDVVMDDTGIEDSTTDSFAPDSFAPETAVDGTTEDTADTSIPDASDASMTDGSDTSMTDGSGTSSDTSETSLGDAADASDGDSVAETTDAADGDTPPPEPEVWVVRAGEDTKDLDSKAAKVQIERIRLSDKAKVGIIDFPSVTTDGGVSSTFTLRGDAYETDGALTRSVDGKFVTMGGYLAPVGYSDIATSETSKIPRVVARIDAAATVDISTTTTDYSNETLEAVLTRDGTSYWLASSYTIRTITHGTSGPASTALLPVDAGTSAGARSLAVWGAQMFGAEPGLFEITPPTRTVLPGTTAPPGYNAVVVSPASGTSVDTLYACSLYGSLDRWNLGVSGWMKTRSFTIPSADSTSTVGCMRLSAAVVDGQLMLFAITYEPPPRLVAIVDGMSPAVTTIATSSDRRPYLGVAFAPHP